jgi:hypothetical protein
MLTCGARSETATGSRQQNHGTAPGAVTQSDIRLSAPSLVHVAEALRTESSRLVLTQQTSRTPRAKDPS